MNSKLLSFLFMVLMILPNFDTIGILHAEPQSSPKDLHQAEKLLSQLPPACGSSYMSTESDGTAVVYIVCRGSGKSMNGVIEIKDGIIKKVH